MYNEKSQKQLALEAAFSKYLKLGIIDDISASNKELKTYYAPLKPGKLNVTENSYQCSSVILKELDSVRLPIYETLSTCWNPYLETVFGVFAVGEQLYSISDYISTPTVFRSTCSNLTSLTLEDFVANRLLQRNLTEEEALIFLYELCEGLKTLHEHQLFHGDLSPNNILLTDCSLFNTKEFAHISGLHNDVALKIIDFGNSKVMKRENHAVTTVIGTKPFAAPDILDFMVPIDAKSDIYSLGCILGYLLTGFSPKEQNIEKLVSPRIWKLICNCTTSYHNRFSSVDTLQTYIKNFLAHNRHAEVLQHIPGFRSNTTWKKVIAGYYYIAVLSSSIVMTIVGMFPKSIIAPSLLLFYVIAFFDVFHLWQTCNTHIRFLRIHTQLSCYLQKIIALALMYIISYLLGGLL